MNRLAIAAMSFVLLVPFTATAQEALAESTLEASSVQTASACPELLTAAPDGFRCPWELYTFSPLELWEYRYAAIAAKDLDRVMCTYARDAVVIMPGMVMHGRDEIRPVLGMMFSLFPDAPVMTSVTTEGKVLMVTFHIEGPFLSVPDGSDTYVIEHGLIHYQTVHDSMVPTAL